MTSNGCPSVLADVSIEYVLFCLLRCPRRYDRLGEECLCDAVSLRRVCMLTLAVYILALEPFIVL